MKVERKIIIPPALTLLLLSLGGWLLHLRMHPISDNPANFIPFIIGLLNIMIIPLFFINNNTMVLAYLINGFSVIIGTIVMADLSLSSLPYPLTIGRLFLKTTIPYICILSAKLFAAQTILTQYFPAGTGRLFTAAWWARHFCYLSIIYVLGHQLWG